MIELPEAITLANQINRTVAGKKIIEAEAAHSPHKFAFYNGDPSAYNGLLAGKTIGEAVPRGAQVEILIGDISLLISDGVNLRYLYANEKVPEKRQMLITLEDNNKLVASIQMYGGLWVFPAGDFDNEYYLAAKNKTSPVTDAFDKAYFDSLFTDNTARLSLKAFLATEQRIPGLGNGVLQDILFNAQMHPKRKVGSLSGDDKNVLFEAVKSTLKTMIEKGGRDTDTDLFGLPGGYKTILSKNTVARPCPVCGGEIMKEAYMGGSVYYCPACQKIG